MNNLEITGKTVEEATRKALTQLNVGLDEIEITVLHEGRSGILGIGSEEARIRVSTKTPKAPVSTEGQFEDVAQEVLAEILKLIGFKASIEQDTNPLIIDEEDETAPVTLNIIGEDLGMLIGRRGQTLDALQYLVRLISSKRTDSKSPVVIDIEGYKKRRYEELRSLALSIAQQVKRTRNSIRMEPMSPYERRIVHMTLADDPEIITESVGEGDARKVMVILKEKY